MSRQDCKSWEWAGGAGEWPQLPVALEQVEIPGRGPPPRVHRNRSSAAAAALAWGMKTKWEKDSFKSLVGKGSPVVHWRWSRRNPADVLQEAFMWLLLFVMLIKSHIQSQTHYMLNTALSILHILLHLDSTTTLWSNINCIFIKILILIGRWLFYNVVLVSVGQQHASA